MLNLFFPLFIDLRFIDVIDIIFVAGLLYGLYYLLRGTVAINIFLGIVAVLLIWKVVTALQMELLGDILGAFVSVGFIALIIIFQPEIRQFLLALGTPGFVKRFSPGFSWGFLRFKSEQHIDLVSIANACISMAEKKTGALIVITRQNELFQTIQSGVQIDANVSQALIEQLFYKNTPLHDGAVIISGNRIKAAGCILPVTKKLDLPGRPGLRHRAGLGMTEQSDAVAIIVSEENGGISFADSGSLRKISNVELIKTLQTALHSSAEK